MSATSSDAEDDRVRVPDGDIFPKYYIGNNADSIISTSTGELTRIEKLVDIPVAGEISMSLNLKYSSGSAWYAPDNYGSSYLIPESPQYGVAAGWGYDLPYILDENLYIPEYGMFEIRSITGSRYGEIVLNDKVVDYLTVCSYAKNISGTKTYFDEVYTKNGTVYCFVNNIISKISDRFGNYIEYETYWSNYNTFLSKMSDSFGRTVTFSVQNNNDIIITLPNGSTTVLDIATMTSSEDSDAPGEDVTVLAGVRRNAGETSISSYYSYTLYDGNTYNTMYSYSNTYYPSALLTCGINNQGAINRYSYETSTCTNYSDTIYTCYRIVENSVNDSFDSSADYITYTYAVTTQDIPMRITDM